MKQPLLTKIAAKQALIAIVGLGYVGLPVALRFAEAGFHVLGLDIGPAKPEHIAAGRTYIEHIPSDAISRARAQGFETTTDSFRVRAADALIHPSGRTPRARPELCPGDHLNPRFTSLASLS